jgi:hypothetical protein
MYDKRHGADRPIARVSALRKVDPGTQTWAIWWLGNTNRHMIDVPSLVAS